MKSFIVAALLVAAVAGQSMDMLKLKEKALLSKFDRPLMRDLLVKKLGYPMEKQFTYGDDYYRTDLPFTYEDKVFIPLEELVSHPLFQEYINLPLFRQYWTYPAFQKFVTSVHFQKLWQNEQFKQYFYNPVLFYKYILPIVNLYKTDITIPSTNYYYGDELIKDQDYFANRNVFPVATGFERDLLKDNKYLVPSIYNEELKFKDDLLVKTLLTKIYSHVYNIPEELVKEHFLTPTTYTNKIVDPITGEWKKIVDDKYTTTTYPFNKQHFNTWDHTTYGDDKIVKDAILKKYLLNKMITKDDTPFQTIMPEEMLMREKMMKMNPIVARMMGHKTFNKYNTFNRFDRFETPFNKFETFDRYETPFNKFETFDTVDKMDLIKEELMKKELIKDEILKKELLKDQILFNKYYNDKEIDTFGKFETVPKVVDFTTPMMGVRTFDKKVETIVKA